MKFKYLQKIQPNYELLELFTGCKRKDSVAFKAWLDLENLIMYGKECLGDNNSRRRKKWIHKIRDRGLCSVNFYSSRWRLNSAGCKIIIDYCDKLEKQRNENKNI